MGTYSDADRVGCEETRKPTIGGCVAAGGHAIKGWSETQAVIPLRPGEFELYAALKAAVETMGALAIFNDIWWIFTGEVWGDASAAFDIINRQRLGQTRHIEMWRLWIQQVAAQERPKF